MISGLVNGVYTTNITLSNRSFAFGDGVFETCKIRNGNIVYADYHFKRLQQGVKTLRISLDLSLLRVEIKQILHNAKNVVLKIIISRGESERGYGFTNAAVATRILMLSENTTRHPTHLELGFCHCGYFSNPNLAGIKHQNRLEQILARKNGADCIMLDERNSVISTTCANIFIIKNNNLYTPNLDNCGILGTRRAVIIDNFNVKICPVSIQQLLSADEVFITNALIGVQAINTIQHAHFHTAITQNIKKFIESGATL